jgi:hypothetical protein
MPKGNTLPRLLIASLTAVAVAAPAAVAQPIDMQRTVPVQREIAQQDLRTETSALPAYPSPATKAAQKDLRTEASALPAYPSPATKAAQKDLRTENAVDPSRKPVPSYPRALPGPPSWPMHPKPITPAHAPAAADDGDGGGIDLPVALIGIAGVLALGGGLTVVALRTRSRARVAH